MKLSLLLLTVLFLASCCGIPQKPVLALPDPITCPKPTDKELENVSKNTYAEIADLYITCVENDKTLRDIIKSTH